MLAHQRALEDTVAPATCPNCGKVMALTRVVPIFMSGGREEQKYACEPCGTVDYRICQSRKWQIAAE